MRFARGGWLDRLLHRPGGHKPDILRRSLRPVSAGLGKVLRTRGNHKFARYLEAFLEGTSDCVFFLDRHWRITFLNRCAARELPGGAALVGANIWEAFPQAVGTIFEQGCRHAVAGNAAQVFEAYYPPLSTWYEVNAVPVEGGLTVFFRNINERLAAAEALRARERQLATVFGQTMVGVLHRDLKQQVLMVNQRFCDIVGRTRDELNGLPIGAFTHPDDIEANLAVFSEHLKTGEPFQIEKRYLRPDGSSLWCAVNVSFVRDGAGKIVSMITVAEDISARKVAEEKLREGHHLLQVVTESIQDLIFVKDRDGRFVFGNRWLKERCGVREGQRDRDLFSPDVAHGFEVIDRHVLASGEVTTVEEVIPICGEPRRFQTVKVPWRQDNETVGVIGVSRDMTERLEAEAQLRESQRQLATLIDNLPGLVYRCTLTPPWPFDFMSEGAAALTGYSAGDFTEGRITWAEIVHPDDLEDLSQTIARSIEERRPFSRVYRIIMRSGDVRWVMERGQCIYGPSGDPSFLEGIINDVTVQKDTEERLRWSAHHDSMTLLPNRTLFQERLDEALKQSGGKGRKVGLMLLDVDHLKEVNDTLGHDAGDALLQTVAKRLGTAIRPMDTVARNGGDEFGIILPDLDGEHDLNTLVEPILARLKEPFTYGGHVIDCQASIGASLWPDHADDGAGLLKQADVALSTVKASGRGKVMIFEPTMRAQARRRATMRNNAREAIDARRIEPYYQPKVFLESGGLAGFEALLRWRNQHMEIEFPSEIQAAFEDPRLAEAIGRQMHDQVFQDMRRWLDAGIDFGHVAINVSAAEFKGSEFADQVLERLRAMTIPSRFLELEVTETVFLGQGAEHVEKALRILSQEGVRIALDDFGTGYASLSHLKQFPVDILKIDRSFVRDLADNPNDTAILLAVLHLGRSLGIKTVAEGIETQVQADFLRAQGCDMGQGYLFGKAAPRGDIPALVTSWNAARFGTR
jgi:diguanylate cyclase (GGDEF)-like protein/PAS domain S-box-containing protein